MNQQEFYNRIISNTLTVLSIEGREVDINTNKNTIIDYLKNREHAQKLASLGKDLKNKGNFEASEILYIQSLVIEDSLQNFYGMASDLGNLGLIYLDSGNIEGALEILKKALEIDDKNIWHFKAKHLDDNLNEKDLSKDISYNKYLTIRLPEYNSMKGIHLECISRCYIKLKDFKMALTYAQCAKESYIESKNLKYVEYIQELTDWILSKINKI